MPTLADILSYIDSAKRQASDDVVGATARAGKGAFIGTADLLDMLTRAASQLSGTGGANSTDLGNTLRSRWAEPELGSEAPAPPTAIERGTEALGLPVGSAAKAGLSLAALGKGLPLAAMAGMTKDEGIAKLLGAFDTTTAGRIINRTKEGGGYSVNLATGDVPETGLMMGKYRNTDPRNMQVPGDMLNRAALEEFIAKNRDALSDPRNYLGLWRNPDEDMLTHLDVSRRFDPEQLRLATKTGERTDQLAGYNVGTKSGFPVGNWEDFVRSPEFHERMRELASEGSQYMQQFPQREWWDIHGGPFERVYGQENLPQAAGFLGATAPNATPKENIQTMTEYMRRHIVGEPILQPDWRVGPDEMTRVEGKRIGQESTRAANLVKASRGDLSSMGADKVREEVGALMGDPNAFVGDRWWARVAEKPQAGIYTAVKDGILEPGKQYLTLKDSVAQDAAQAGRPLRDYSADVWAGIRERVRRTGELYGTPYDTRVISRSESKSYSDTLNDIIADKAKHLGIGVDEMEHRLRNGDATLLGVMLTSPVIAAAYAAKDEQQQ